MNIAISTIAWERYEDDVISSLLQKFGITAIEVAPTKINTDLLAMTETEAITYRTYWQKKRINIIALQSVLFGKPNLSIFGNKTIVSETEAYLKKVIDICSWLGAKYIVFGSPKNRQREEGVSMPEAFLLAAQFFRNVADYAATKEIFFCIEPNPPLYGCNFITNTQEAISFIQQVNHPYFQLHLDAAIMTMNDENIAESIGEAIPYLKHFHVSEKNLDIIRISENHTSIAQALISNNYQGHVSIEMRSGIQHSNTEGVTIALQNTLEMYK